MRFSSPESGPSATGGAARAKNEFIAGAAAHTRRRRRHESPRLGGRQTKFGLGSPVSLLHSGWRQVTHASCQQCHPHVLNAAESPGRLRRHDNSDRGNQPNLDDFEPVSNPFPQADKPLLLHNNNSSPIPMEKIKEVSTAHICVLLTAAESPRKS